MFAAKADNDVVVGTAVSSNANWSQVHSLDEKKQPTRCRDPLFAVLLYANVAAIIGIAIKFGSNPFTAEVDADDASTSTENFDYTGVLYTCASLAGFAVVCSAFMLQVMVCIPGLLIKIALLFNVVLSGIAAAFGFYSGSMVLGIVCLIFFAIMVCYAKLVWSRIPFATANLKTGTSAVKANCGVIMVSYIFTALAVAWTILWFISLAGIQDQIIECTTTDTDEGSTTVCTNPNYLYMFLLFISLYFTQQVLQNCVHCTVAGTVGSWWFSPSSSGCCASAVFGAFIRTLTTSFGSICFGSLLVAIIQALRQILNSARQNEDAGAMLACCIDCILSCIESLLEYFNKWAFVYVGLYGYGYCEAGKSVMQLFKDRGWEVIIADDLVGMVLFLLSLIVGLLTGAAGILLEDQTTWFESFEGSGVDLRVLVFVLGLIIGLLLCSIVMSVIASSVNTAIVLFAEAPAEFERNYPTLSHEMREAYMRAHPGCRIG